MQFIKRIVNYCLTLFHFLIGLFFKKEETTKEELKIEENKEKVLEEKDWDFQQRLQELKEITRGISDPGEAARYLFDEYEKLRNIKRQKRHEK